MHNPRPSKQSNITQANMHVCLKLLIRIIIHKFQSSKIMRISVQYLQVSSYLVSYTQITHQSSVLPNINWFSIRTNYYSEHYLNSAEVEWIVL